MDLQETIYADVAPANVNAHQVQQPTDVAAEEIEVNPSASLNEWLQKAMPTSQDFEVCFVHSLPPPPSVFLYILVVHAVP